MSKKRLLLEVLSILVLVVPNLVYMLCNLQVFKEAHYLALTMVAIIVLCIIGLGALIHFKAKAGIWLAIIGVFVLVMSNISYVAGIALIIEGVCLSLDSYLIKPLVIRLKIKELEENVKSVTYTKSID